MATLHKEFIRFNDKIGLTDSRKDKLIRSRDALRDKINEYFYYNKPNELQPKFKSQGSFETDTAINPIPEFKGNDRVLKYDLDDGVYFVEINGRNNRKNISTWHDWVFNAVEFHTNITPKRKNTCVRVIFADGHHIDLPIYYEKNGYYPQLAHRSEGWITSDPLEFIDWFESQPNIKQLKRIVRYLKAWKNYRESNNTNLKFPSGFGLTILATNNFVPKSGKDDVAFMETVRKIKDKLNRSFSCKRPTTPKNEDLFKDYSYTRKDNFLKALDSLLNNCENAWEETNFKTASEYMIDYCFGDRFPLGDNINQRQKAAQIGSLIGSNPLAKKPYAK